MNSHQLKSILTADERIRRDELESVVGRGIASFVEVGNALMEIADKRLYRETHGSFEPYCREKWGMSARRAYQLCEAASVVVNHGSQITNERQARELAKVPEDQREEVLEMAGPNPTAKKIAEAAEAIKPPSKDEEFKSACGVTDPMSAIARSVEPRVTEYYDRLESIVTDALENASVKQLNSMGVYAAMIPKLIKEAIKLRSQP